MPDAQDLAAQPVIDREGGVVPPKPPADGISLCLSGGGYRAMLFHVGVLWRLNEVGLLRRLAQVSSVSGGSITAGLLGLRWDEIFHPSVDSRAKFLSLVVEPIRSLANKTIDAGSIVAGLLSPFSTIGDRIAASYREHLYGDATLQDLPAKGDRPEFVICATNVQSGVLWRFTRAYMGDYRVGRVPNPTLSLAVAVGASSAFPPVLSPARISIDPATVRADPYNDLHREPFTSEIVLSDGGVYDNLGLEPSWKHFKTVLVSDAGAKIAAQPEPKGDWGNHSLRINELIDNQVRSLRKRQLVASYQAPDGDPNQRRGAYWGMRTNIADYGLPDALPCPFSRTLRLAEIPTRLARMESAEQERVMNWGYAACDAALRSHVLPNMPGAPTPPPPVFPYSTRGV